MNQDSQALTGGQIDFSQGSVVTLMSGGIDSSSVIAKLKEENVKLSGMFIDYGQPAAKSEWEAAQNVAEYYQIKIEKVELGFRLMSDEGEFFGRNALMILTAAGIIEDRPLCIAIGIHALTDYYDTTPLFLKHVQRVLNGYSSGSVAVHAPFISKTKPEVIELANKIGVPINLTYSCEWQDAPACGLCPSCRDRGD